MTAIFNHYHNKPYDAVFVNSFITDQLAKKPAGFTEQEVPDFFLQHAALETMYHLKISVPVQSLLPFLNDRNNFHHQVSAARAIRSSFAGEARPALMAVIGDTSRRDFVRVMGILSLSEMRSADLKPQLTQLNKNASDEADGFGGNIMDPRICARLPSMKEALTKLIATL